eukprot:s1_g858.t1
MERYRIGGSERQDFLQNLLTNNLDRVSPTQAVYTLLQTPQGKYLFDFFVVEQDGHYLIDCDRDTAPELLKRLMFYKLRADVTLESLGEEWVVGAVWEGDDAGEPGKAEPWHGGVLFSDPRLLALGERMMVPVASAETALSVGSSCSPEDYESHRLALGVPGSQDLIADKTFPMEANLDLLNAIDFQKGCFVGQEVTSRTHRKGQVRKRIVTVSGNGDLPPPHTTIMAGERQAGELLSSSGAQGLALLRLDRLAEPLAADGVDISPSFPAWMPDGAGLSWITILKKRDNFRKAFDGFQPEKIARYSPKKVDRLLKDAGIIRHRGKIEATIGNAKAYLEIMEKDGSFADFLWDFVDGAPVQNSFKTMKAVPAETEMSRKLSKELKARGFKFCGPTIVYAFAQAVGMVNDHTTDCFRHQECAALAKR